MNKTISVLILYQLLVLGAALAQEAPADSGAPISFRPLRPGEPAPVHFGPRAAPWSETIFLFTNHSAKAFVAHFSAVEIKNGSNWITQMRLRGPIMFAATNSYRMPGATNAFSPGLTTFELGPHQAAYATVHFSGGPVADDPRLGPYPQPGTGGFDELPQ